MKTMPRPPVSVLMYHAIVDDGEAPAGADLHYAVSRRTFGRHLELARQCGLAVVSVRALLDAPRSDAVAFTFDDGHASNAWAAQALHEAGGSADFFVNSAHVGRPGFLGWPELRAMAAAGMSIQSHGHQHRYLDELDAAGVEDELRRSKQILEDGLGRAVTLFAPPAGASRPGWWTRRGGWATTPCAPRGWASGAARTARCLGSPSCAARRPLARRAGWPAGRVKFWQARCDTNCSARVRGCSAMGRTTSSGRLSWPGDDRTPLLGQHGAALLCVCRVPAAGAGAGRRAPAACGTGTSRAARGGGDPGRAQRVGPACRQARNASRAGLPQRSAAHPGRVGWLDR
ncbi:polysaccharide deacetylase family protein [Piscinibacter aquaticus]|uniref:Polysaccharide deacetylase family protein n=1 Tax=Piscinibacter aquaticus TaxID=392597 RepID=A0A5C6U0Z8_9BURK|nr:polysaccharide deacetylase family protein [Piscinibacter aquaticus]